MAEERPDISDESFATRMLYKTIRSKFSNVSQLGTETLGEWLFNNDSKCEVLLVDVREKEEHGISSIKGTIKITPNDGTEQVLSILQNSQIIKVVAFCSLGYRSCKLIQTLYTDLKKARDIVDIDLYNLEGGLFKWANENRPLVDMLGNKTTFVHPYNTVFGKFLEHEKRKYPDGSHL